MRLARVGILLLLVLSGGCIGGAPTSQIPGWIGIPANLITPNSLEAETYRNQQACRQLAPSAALSSPIAGVQ